RELLRKIEQLEQDKRDLLSRSAHMAAVTDRFTTRYAEVEGELANLANLYVATSQLHGAHSVRSVLRHLKELLAQFVGAGAFAVYLVADDGKELVAIASEGVPSAEIARVPADQSAIGRAFATGEVVCSHRKDLSKLELSDPAAVVPLALDGRTVGIIAIFALLTQKTEFLDVDTEMFKLLRAHAVPALVSARLFTEKGRKLPTVQAF